VYLYDKRCLGRAAHADVTSSQGLFTNALVLLDTPLRQCTSRQFLKKFPTSPCAQILEYSCATQMTCLRVRIAWKRMPSLTRILPSNLAVFLFERCFLGSDFGPAVVAASVAHRAGGSCRQRARALVRSKRVDELAAFTPHGTKTLEKGFVDRCCFLLSFFFCHF